MSKRTANNNASLTRRTATRADVETSSANVISQQALNVDGLNLVWGDKVERCKHESGGVLCRDCLYRDRRREELEIFNLTGGGEWKSTQV